MPAREREHGELPSPDLSLFDRKVRRGLFVFTEDAGSEKRLYANYADCRELKRVSSNSGQMGASMIRTFSAARSVDGSKFR